jgi:hypothetical protein
MEHDFGPRILDDRSDGVEIAHIALNVGDELAEADLLKETRAGRSRKGEPGDLRA